MGKFLYNKSDLTKTRKSLRNNQTQPEKIFWDRVKTKQFFGLKFRRQYSVGRYIIDFYCKDLKLVIEIDGDSHFSEEAKLYDEERTRFLEATGLKVERFTNKEVMENIEGILQYLEEKYIKM
ncbi:hypothetical protein CSB08_00225 [Candidatus Gracilibacteria bacterium]|nr:MAG: hypothetical protein CSB08_00225 [Candidatus Gracilibacteria bacterium]PIE85270.1 MAG: hypothetical protein CSA08_02575 [Candidatus Gracilibacteria bacterium]